MAVRIEIFETSHLQTILEKELNNMSMKFIQMKN